MVLPHALRQAGQQQRHPRHVAVIFPARLAQPKITSSMREGSSPGFRASSAFSGSAAVVSASSPWHRRNGQRVYAPHHR